MANGHGGARPGAGRPSKAVTHAAPVKRAEKAIADRLPKLIDNLIFLADGGYEQVEERWEPAGSVTRGGVLTGADGQPLVGPRGGIQRGPVPAFPDLPADQLVLVSRTVSVAAPDRASNEYLIDRVMGTPTERHEVFGPDGQPFKVYLNVDVEKV